MGSKNSIARQLVRQFPKADNFYDLFGGGFAITDAMLINRPNDYKQFHFNEIRLGICGLIKDAISGKFNYDVFKPDFISRERFIAEKDLDIYIRIIWSFGNNGKKYLFSKEIEPYKKSMHDAIVFNRFDDLAEKTLGIKEFKEGYSINQRRLFLRNRIVVLHGRDKQLQQLQQLQQLLRLEQLQQLERLQQLQHLQQLEFYSQSYELIPIKENSIIYCDPPYRGTGEYDGPFDHDHFLNWCSEQKCPVFISEYNIAHPDFRPIWRIPKFTTLSCGRSVKKFEMLYSNRAGFEALRKSFS